MLNNLEIILDGVHFAEEFFAAKTGAEKKSAAVGFIRFQLNKVVALQATTLDDMAVDLAIEAAVRFMNKFKKEKQQCPG